MAQTLQTSINEFQWKKKHSHQFWNKILNFFEKLTASSTRRRGKHEIIKLYFTSHQTAYGFSIKYFKIFKPFWKPSTKYNVMFSWSFYIKVVKCNLCASLKAKKKKKWVKGQYYFNKIIVKRYNVILTKYKS